MRTSSLPGGGLLSIEPGFGAICIIMQVLYFPASRGEGLRTTPQDGFDFLSLGGHCQVGVECRTSRQASLDRFFHNTVRWVLVRVSGNVEHRR